MEIDMRNQRYESHDLGECAALLSVGISMLHTKHDHSGRVLFIFEDSERLQKTIKDHWGCNLEVKSRYYFDAIKNLKNTIYGGAQ
jgi:Domain of unknown function (DUF5659)